MKNVKLGDLPEAGQYWSLMTLDFLGTNQTMLTTLAINNGIQMLEYGGQQCHGHFHLYDGSHIWDKIENVKIILRKV
jgi:hypothetical protein